MCLQPEKTGSITVNTMLILCGTTATARSSPGTAVGVDDLRFILRLNAACADRQGTEADSVEQLICCLHSTAII